MKVVRTGMIYQLRNMDGISYQEVRFNRKRPDNTFFEGTTVEEVLQMLRHKFYHFQSISPSMHNEEAIKYIDLALDSCHNRLMDKKDMLKDVTDKKNSLS